LHLANRAGQGCQAILFGIELLQFLQVTDTRGQLRQTIARQIELIQIDQATEIGWQPVKRLSFRKRMIKLCRSAKVAATGLVDLR
jgi:hypothetical protein